MKKRLCMPYSPFVADGQSNGGWVIGIRRNKILLLGVAILPNPALRRKG